MVGESGDYDDNNRSTTINGVVWTPLPPPIVIGPMEVQNVIDAGLMEED